MGANLHETKPNVMRSLGAMSEACRQAAKWKSPKSLRESERIELIASLNDAAEFLQYAAPSAASIGVILGRPIR
jgi:hypothetical protein